MMKFHRFLGLTNPNMTSLNLWILKKLLNHKKIEDVDTDILAYAQAAFAGGPGKVAVRFAKFANINAGAMINYTDMLVKIDEAEYEVIKAKFTPLGGTFEPEVAAFYRLVGTKVVAILPDVEATADVMQPTSPVDMNINEEGYEFKAETTTEEYEIVYVGSEDKAMQTNDDGDVVPANTKPELLKSTEKAVTAK